MNGTALSGPDVLAGRGVGVVLEAPTIVFVGRVGLTKRIGKRDEDVARRDAIDGVRGDGDLSNDQAIGSGGSDSRTDDVAGGFLAASRGLAAGGGVERRSSSAGDVVEEEGGTAGGTASHREGDGESGTGGGIGGVEGLDIAGSRAVIESRADLSVGVTVTVGDGGNIEIGTVIGGGDDEIAGRRELERDGAALAWRNGLLLHVNDADAGSGKSAGRRRFKSNSNGIPAIGGADAESGRDGAVSGLDLELSGLREVGAREPSGSAEKSPGSRALEPLLGTGGTVFLGVLEDEIAIGGGGESRSGDGSDEVTVGRRAVKGAGKVDPLGGIDHGDVLRHAAGEGDSENAGTGGGKDAVGGDGLVAVAVRGEEGEVVAFVISDGDRSTGVGAVLEGGNESIARKSAIGGEVGGIGVHGDASGIGAAFGPDERGDGGAAGRGGGGSGGRVGVGAEIIGSVGSTDAIGVGSGSGKASITEGGNGRRSDLGKVRATRSLAPLDQISGNS